MFDTFPLNLRGYSRWPEKSLADIYLERWGEPRVHWIQAGAISRVHWIQAGAISLSETASRWSVGCRASIGMTDEEHDSAWVFRFDAVGVRMTLVDNGNVWIEGWIGGDSPKDFHVPSTSLPPETRPCTVCPEPHPIGPYIPEANPEMWAQVRGLKFEILMHPPHDGKEA